MKEMLAAIYPIRVMEYGPTVEIKLEFLIEETSFPCSS